MQSAFSSHGLESAEHSSISNVKGIKQNVKFVPTVIFYLTNRVQFFMHLSFIDHAFRHNIVKVPVDSRMDPQTTLAILRGNLLLITGQTH